MLDLSQSWYAIVTTRDGWPDVKTTIESLLNQTHPPADIIVIDDGSVDGTDEYLYTLAGGMAITLYRTENKTRDFSRLPLLWNMGLRKDHDYVLIMPDDVELPPDYAEKIIEQFQHQPKLVAASGDIEPFGASVPHGGGRFIRLAWFFQYYDKFPHLMGYESELIEKARMTGCYTKCFNDIHMEHLRPLGKHHNFSEFGQSRKAFGWHFGWAIYTAWLARKNPHIGRKGALKIIWYYLTYRPQRQGGYYSVWPKEFRDYQYWKTQKQFHAMLKLQFHKLLFKLRLVQADEENEGGVDISYEAYCKRLLS